MFIRSLLKRYIDWQLGRYVKAHELTRDRRVIVNVLERIGIKLRGEFGRRLRRRNERKALNIKRHVEELLSFLWSVDAGHDYLSLEEELHDEGDDFPPIKMFEFGEAPLVPVPKPQWHKIAEPMTKEELEVYFKEVEKRKKKGKRAPANRLP